MPLEGGWQLPGLARSVTLPKPTSIRDKLNCLPGEGVQVRRGFLGLAAVGDEPFHQVDQEVEQAAIAGVLDLAAVLAFLS